MACCHSQEPTKSAKISTKNSNATSGKDTGTENADEVRYSLINMTDPNGCLAVFLFSFVACSLFVKMDFSDLFMSINL